MIVVNKKIKVVIITLLIVLEVASTYLMYRSFNNKNVILDNVKLKGATTKKSGLAIMIEQEDGTYKESTSSTWPEDMMYNDEKSGCIDDKGNAIDGALTYEGGVANIRTKSSSYCFLYFDLIKDDVTIAISTDGESGVMPSSGKYTNSATCSSGSIAWSDKYQRIEIGDLTKQSMCNLTFIKDTSSKTLLKNKVEEVNVNNNYDSNGYRYSGKNPDNYIWFNNEMWRIIGSIPTKIDSDGTIENLVKIIRNTPIGTLSSDAKSSGYTAVWGNNTLYNLLNSYYYGALDATETDYCSTSSGNGFTKTNCNYTIKGIKQNGYYGKMIKEVYWYNGPGVTAGIASYSFTREKESNVLGYIGLMAASDYGYAADSSYHSTYLSKYVNSAIVTDWLYAHGDERLISKLSGEESGLNVDVTGIVEYGNIYTAYTVRPVVYLDSNIFIISGTGTESDPYIIGM